MGESIHNQSKSKNDPQCFSLSAREIAPRGRAAFFLIAREKSDASRASRSCCASRIGVLAACSSVCTARVHRDVCKSIARPILPNASERSTERACSVQRASTGRFESYLHDGRRMSHRHLARLENGLVHRRRLRFDPRRKSERHRRRLRLATQM